jgi:hypothetical protein
MNPFSIYHNYLVPKTYEKAQKQNYLKKHKNTLYNGRTASFHKTHEQSTSPKERQSFTQPRVICDAGQCGFILIHRNQPQ